MQTLIDRAPPVGWRFLFIGFPSTVSVRIQFSGAIFFLVGLLWIKDDK
jgi:hypothetical protein